MKRYLAAAALVVASLLLSLLAFEGVLRAMRYSAPTWYEPDARLGWTLRPGVAAWWTREGRAYVQINSAGMRDREHALDKPKDVFRIAVLGDSFSEAMQLPMEQTFWALLPARLEQCGLAGGRRIEVLNFGVSAYGTAQELLMLETKATRYRPDLVLLQFMNGNDVANNSPALEAEKERPFFVFRNGTLELDDSFAHSSAFARRNSRSGEWLRTANDLSRVVQLLHAVSEMSFMARAHAGSAGGIEQGLEPMVLAPPRSAAWEDAWRVTEALIAKAAAHAASHGAKFVVFTVPYAAQVHPDRNLRSALAAKIGVADLFYPDRRIAEYARRTGIEAIVLAPEMQRLADERGTFFHGFENVGIGVGHWNAQGHRAAADLIARRLCSPGQ
jgi:GDSL-like Lipase/Acylhydrolase family